MRKITLAARGNKLHVTIIDDRDPIWLAPNKKQDTFLGIMVQLGLSNWFPIKSINSDIEYLAYLTPPNESDAEIIKKFMDRGFDLHFSRIPLQPSTSKLVFTYRSIKSLHKLLTVNEIFL